MNWRTRSNRPRRKATSLRASHRQEETLMGLPVITVASGGLPIVEATAGTPVTEVSNGLRRGGDQSRWQAGNAGEV